MKQAIGDTENLIGRVRLPFRADVEGLRALAITLVVLSHACLPFFRSGFIGVDIFFVLSGYLITGLLVQEIQSTGRLNFARFYARRARRLLPAAMLLVLAVCSAEAIVISPFMQLKVLKAALATVFYSSNLYFAHLNLQYFEQESATNPLLRTWSLAVEEQFYLFWPILLLFLTRLSKSRRRITITVAIMAAVSFIFCVGLTRINPSSAFFLPLPRLWEFCAGGIIDYVPIARIAGLKRSCAWMGAAGLLLLLLGAEWVRAWDFPGYLVAIPVLGTMAVLLVGAAAPDSPIPRLLSMRPMLILGGLSYSLYLWHWPALVIAQQLFPSDALAVRLAAIGVAVLLAAFTHYTVENPIRFNRFLASRSGIALKLAVASAILCACGLGGWRLILNHTAQFQKFNSVVQDISRLYGLGCASERTDSAPHLCTFGDTAGPSPTVVLFGDSHAAEWFPALEQMAVAQHWKLVTIVKPGCTPLNLTEEVSPKMKQVCAEWRRLSIEETEQLHPYVVLVSSASLHPGSGGRLVTDVAVWEQAARDTFAGLTQSGANVRFIRDTPHADYNVLECLAQAEWDRRTRCATIEPAIALYPDIYAAEQRGALGLNHFAFIDLSDAFCGARECYPEVAGTVVYRDRDHLTATYSRSLSELLFQRLSDSMHK